ncbi:MAG: low temperature requirement protein A [Ilumatobacteraceae bacterium]
MSEAPQESAARERHATNLELFLDLVFVFAVTQIASLISHHPTGTGTAKGLLIALLVWWQWSQFTWAGSAIDLQRTVATRVLVLGCIPVTLIMTIAIPDAFHETGLWFGVAYLGVQLIVLGMQASVSLRDPALRGAFIRYASLATVAPVVVLIGAFFHDDVRVEIWVVAAVLNFIGGLRASSGEWAINPVHFAERHSLFVIISLGEVLIAAGATASEISTEGLQARTAIAIAVAVAVACTLWWTYFAYIPAVGEDVLRESQGAERGRYARDLFTFGHFPVVFGLILYAVVVKHLIPHPDGHLSLDDRWLLASFVICFVGGLMAFQFRVIRRVSSERIVAVPVAIGLCMLGRWLPGLVVIGSIAVLLAVMQTITMRRFKGGSHAHVLDER